MLWVSMDSPARMATVEVSIGQVAGLPQAFSTFLQPGAWTIANLASGDRLDQRVDRVDPAIGGTSRVLLHCTNEQGERWNTHVDVTVSPTAASMPATNEQMRTRLF